MKEKEFYIKELWVYRKEIDKIDNKIINLLNKRGMIIQKVGFLKKQGNINIEQPQREKEIIERMQLKSKILKKVSIGAIWREVIKACKLIQNLNNSD